MKHARIYLENLKVGEKVVWPKSENNALQENKQIQEIPHSVSESTPVGLESFHRILANYHQDQSPRVDHEQSGLHGVLNLGFEINSILCYWISISLSVDIPSMESSIPFFLLSFVVLINYLKIMGTVSNVGFAVPL